MHNLSGSWGTFSFHRWNLLHADLSVMSRQRGQSVVACWQSSTIGTEVVQYSKYKSKTVKKMCEVIMCLMLLQVAFCQSFHQHLPVLMLDHSRLLKFYWIGWNSNNAFCLCVLPTALWCFILVSAGTFWESSFIVSSCHVLLKQTWVFPELHHVVMSVYLLAVYDGSLRPRIHPHHLARNDVLPGFENIHCQTILTF